MGAMLLQRIFYCNMLNLVIKSMCLDYLMHRIENMSIVYMYIYQQIFSKNSPGQRTKDALAITAV